MNSRVNTTNGHSSTLCYRPSTDSLALVADLHPFFGVDAMVGPPASLCQIFPTSQSLSAPLSAAANGTAEPGAHPRPGCRPWGSDHPGLAERGAGAWAPTTRRTLLPPDLRWPGESPRLPAPRSLAAYKPPRWGYFSTTLPPAASSFSLAFSAASFVTFSRTGLGALSTRSLASLRPRDVRARTSLMTWIFLSPAAVRTTSNSSFSSSGSAATAAGPAGPATATGAAAVTPNLSSSCRSSSDSSRTVMPPIASSNSCVFAISYLLNLVEASGGLLGFGARRRRGVRCGGGFCGDGFRGGGVCGRYGGCLGRLGGRFR